QYGSIPDARFPHGSCPPSGASSQIRRSSRIGPNEGGTRSRSANPPPDTTARADRVWRKSRQPSYVRLRSRTPTAQGAISHRATWLHPDCRRVRLRHWLVVARRAPRLCGRLSAATARQQSEELFLVVFGERYRARPRRGTFD